MQIPPTNLRGKGGKIKVRLSSGWHPPLAKEEQILRGGECFLRKKEAIFKRKKPVHHKAGISEGSPLPPEVTGKGVRPRKQKAACTQWH